MLNKLKNIIASKNSKVVKNGIWLYILQIFNTVIPLLTLPYITRVLGPSNYGAFSAALNLVGYFQVVVEYGFNLLGAKKVALAKDKKEISEIYSRILLSKLLLLVLTLNIMLIVFVFFNIPKDQSLNMLILYIMVFGGVFQQVWLFQGLQEMKYITLFSVLSRLISVIMIFICIKHPEQMYLYSGLYSLTFLLIGILNLITIRFRFKIRLLKVRFKDILAELKDGWYLFTTSAMTKIFSGIGVTVLVFTGSSSDVGIFAAIQKIPLIIIMVYQPIGQAIYPYISKQYLASFEVGIIKVKNIMKIVMPSVGLLSIFIIIFSEKIINILYGIHYTENSLVLVPLIIWMFLSIFNNFLGIQILVAGGFSKEYSIAFRNGVLGIMIFNTLLGTFGGMYGVAIAAMLAELTLTISIIYQIKKIYKGNSLKKEGKVL